MSIRTLYHEAFMVWASDRGIGRDPARPESEHLVFKGDGGAVRRWPYPSEAARVPQFVATLLGAIRPNDRYWVYPERGVWSLGREAEAWPEPRVWMVTARALGVPAGLRGAVGFNSTDWNALCAMLFLQITLGAAARIETLVVPEIANAILYFDRDQGVSVALREEAQLEPVLGAMNKAGYPLTEKRGAVSARGGADTSSRTPAPGGGSRGARTIPMR
jgi:hypothetical protein